MPATVPKTETSPLYGPGVEPRQYPISQVVGTTLLLTVAFIAYDAARGRELEPVKYVVLLVLLPAALLAGRALYVRRMRSADR